MSALPYQPVPTAAQQHELSRWVSRHYPVRQYEQTQALISPVEAAGVACCDVTDEPDGMSWPVVIGSCIAGLGMWAAVGYATWWLVGLFTGVK